METASEKIQKTQTDTFVCASCGGKMNFDPESQSLGCPFCGNKLQIQKDRQNINEVDFDTYKDQTNSNWGHEKRVTSCKSCGAEVVLDAEKTAQFCSYCGSPHVEKTDASAGLSPESLIPFKVSEDKAKTSFKDWINNKFFAPSALKKFYQEHGINGVYIPCWTYDSQTSSLYHAEAGEYYYVTEKNAQGEEVRVRHTNWRHSSGSYSQFFDDVLVNASKKIDEGLFERLSPFQMSELVKYQNQFLSGFIAERYSVDLKAGWDKALAKIRYELERNIRNQIHADEIRDLSIQTQYSRVTFKHILLPIWISAYTFKGKVYQYMVNGQTGKVVGYAPVSALKVLLTLGIIAVAIAGCLLALEMFGVIDIIKDFP